jgi:enoyl-CoA hydratase/carnithine racemase
MTTPGPVTLGHDGGVTTVTLERPDAMNAISTELVTSLAATFEPLATDGRTRVVILTGAGTKAFCAGADLRERAGMDDAGWMAQREAMRRGFAAVRRCPLPTVAAVFGFALGGGYELALSCDLIVAADDAVVGLPEVRIGLVPGGGGTQLLVRRVGRAVARELILTGRRVEVDKAARAVAAEIMGSSPTAVRLAKWALEVGADLSIEAGVEIEDQAWRRAVLGDERREGIAAWNERRPPDWT